MQSLAVGNGEHVNWQLPKQIIVIAYHKIFTLYCYEWDHNLHKDPR